MSFYSCIIANTLMSITLFMYNKKIKTSNKKIKSNKKINTSKHVTRQNFILSPGLTGMGIMAISMVISMIILDSIGYKFENKLAPHMLFLYVILLITGHFVYLFFSLILYFIIKKNKGLVLMISATLVICFIIYANSEFW